MAKKTTSPTAQTNETPATNTTEKKRIRTKGEYVIERRTLADVTDGVPSWERIVSESFNSTADAMKFIKDPDKQKDPGDYRIVVVKWAKTLKQIQQTITSFE